MRGCKTYRVTGVCRCKLYPLNKNSGKVIKGVEKKKGHCACEINPTEDNYCLGWELTKEEIIKSAEYDAIQSEAGGIEEEIESEHCKNKQNN